ncbi:MAG: serine protease [Candidatus Saccharimonadales bacterium]
MKTDTAYTKRVAIKPKHAKSYRKRHYGLLVIAVVAMLSLFGLLITIRVQIDAGATDSRNFVASTFERPTSTAQPVVSTYGFGLKYDPRRLYVSAVDGSSGKLYIGYELTTPRAYKLLKFSTKLAPTRSGIGPDTISLEYYPDRAVGAGQSLGSVESSAVATTGQSAPMPQPAQTEVVTFNGINFQRTSWRQAAEGGGLSGQLTSEFVTYTAIINNHPLLLRTSPRLGGNLATTDVAALVSSITTGDVTASSATPTATVVAATTRSRSLLDDLLFAPVSASQMFDSQGISALYAPAVVKIYNAYCMDIAIKGQLFVQAACSGTSGSGFFVGGNGVIATNGHVATADPRDVAIQAAYTAAIGGNGQQLATLAELAGLDVAQLSKITDNDILLDTIFSAVYAMPDSEFTTPRAVQNLLVGLDSSDPDVNKLLDATKAYQTYPSNDDIRPARLLAADYRAFDGIIRYHNSDVALIQISGRNFPVARLGSLGDVSQGSSLSILGYPVAASENAVVARNISAVTLTSGKVSAIKSANGDSRQLIETDTTIGHGNSGGPVFGDKGSVVGIATYTIDGSGSGNGTFNYIRDIADLQALATTAGVPLRTASTTQDTWQQAVAAFDSAHYHKALTLFAAVRQLYPQHPTLDSFVGRAEKNIADGKEARDIPLGLLFAAAAGMLMLAGLAVFLIVRHHGKHQVYKLASGQATATPVDPTIHPGGGFHYSATPAVVPVVANSPHIVHHSR